MNHSNPIFAEPAGAESIEIEHPLVKTLLGGNHIVIGAPGSGKTRLLKQLVLQIENLGHKPEEILVLTPSRLGASQLRDALALQSGQASSGPRARSLASFAYGQHQQENPELKLFSGSQQQAVVRELVESSTLAPWGFDPLTVQLDGFIQELRDLLTICLEFGLTSGQLSELAATYSAKQFLVAADLLPKYLSVLAKENALDPSQLIATSPIESTATYVIVDDAQDLSRSALKLVKAVAKDKNLVLFGDPDVSVLGFRSGLPGGFIELFADFTKHFLEPNKSFDFELGRLTSKLAPLLAGPQRNQGTAEPKVSASYFLNAVTEADWLAARIRRERLESGIKFSDISVVARTRRQLEQIASQLSSRSVPVHIVGAQLALRDQYLSRSILELAQLAFAEPTSAQIIQVLESSVVGLDSIGVRRLQRQLAAPGEFENLTKDQILTSAIEVGVEPSSFETRKLNQLSELVRKVRAFESASAYKLVSLIFEAIDSKSMQVLARGRTEPAASANRDLDSALELFAAAIRFDQRNGGVARDFVEQQLAQGLPEDSLAPIGLRDAVQLTTASQLISRRFEVVLIPRLQDGIWPNLRPRSSLLSANSLASYLDGKASSPTDPVRGELEDEVRLFAKAVGSAERAVYLSAMISSEEQPSQFFELLRLKPELQEKPISFDLRRLVGEYRRQLVKGDLSYAPRLAALALLDLPGAHPENWQGLLPISTDELLVSESEPIRFSPSRLEAFEACPLHWFINNFGGDGSGFEASLGTLLHEALEVANQSSDVVKHVESNWHTLEFEADWQATAQKRKALNMASAIAEYLASADELIQAEQKFELNIGRLQIVGKIDRVERDAAGKVHVVDLKTGKVPTQLEVEQHRQLAVYQLAMRQLGAEVASGRIVAVGDQKLKIMEQPPLEGDLEVSITELLARVAREAGENKFVASVSSHCSGDENCQLLLTRAVTHG